jgi:predicted enzyme related to lactoylglutathione lyase
MINGMHAIIYSEDAAKARAFFKDTLGWNAADAGQGWLIFAVPPSEIACHPIDHGGANGTHELYFMCDDLEKTVAELKGKGVEFTQPTSDQGWGILTRFRIPGGGEVGLYQPRHPRPKPL